MEVYKSFSCSTKGASHLKSGLPCQDVSLNDDLRKDGITSIAIVADGHGSPQYFRSDIGAKSAVEVTWNGIVGFIDQNPSVPEDFIKGSGRKALKQLAKYIISSWFSSVSEDEIASPLADDSRIELVEEKYKKKYLNDIDHRNFAHAYGTTLIAFAMTENYWFGFQIGDGKCVVLYEDGTWEQPIPWDDRCFLNSTTSVCDDDSVNEFRYWFGFCQSDGLFTEYHCGVDEHDNERIGILKSRPIAVFIGSDGVDDTYPVFENEKHLVLLYRSIVLSIVAEGFERTVAQVHELARKLAEHGSQDDVSIAGIIGDLSDKANLIKFLSLQADWDKAKKEAEEARKKAEVKKELFQAERQKTLSLMKIAAQQRSEAQKVNQEYEKIRSHISQLRNEYSMQKKSIVMAEQKCRFLKARFEETKQNLQNAEEEEKKQKEIQQVFEEEYGAVESQALQLEEEYQTIEKRLLGTQISENDADERTDRTSCSDKEYIVGQGA